MKTSVALCTYNGESYIKEQLDSILAQSIPVCEIVVCDDGSSDKTLEIIENYQKDNPNILKLFKNTEKLGVIKNFEKAINLCDNDLVFLSDQDDIWFPNKVEKSIKYFEENPNKEAVAHDLKLYENAKYLDYTNWDTLFFTPKLIEELSIIEILIFIGNVVTGAGFAIRKPKYKLILDHISNKFLHDRQLALHFALENKLGFINECLGTYRLHYSQEVGTNISQKNERKQNYELIKSNNLLDKLSKYYADLDYWNWNFKFLDKNAIDKIITNKLLETKKEYFKSLPILKRKKIILIWAFRKRFLTNFKDIFVY